MSLNYSFVRGCLVDLIGIEPMTSSMPWKRAPSCATGPLLGRTSSILRSLPRIVKRWCRHSSRCARCGLSFRTNC
jgi:hypothetical protein